MTKTSEKVAECVGELWDDVRAESNANLSIEVRFGLFSNLFYLFDDFKLC